MIGCDGEEHVPVSPCSRRNGLDCEVKKTYPPDYSNVPSVRDWQMSPFSNERFDLDLIQRAERRGCKGRHELERIKKELAVLRGERQPDKPKPPPCPVCLEREEAERKRRERKTKSGGCKEYKYQPYGPSVASSLSYSCPETSWIPPSDPMNIPRISLPSLVPCPNYFVETPKRDFSKCYVPYGILGDLRFTSNMYVPMGPSIIPRDADY